MVNLRVQRESAEKVHLASTSPWLAGGNLIGRCVSENSAIPFSQFPVKLILLLKNNRG